MKKIAIILGLLLFAQSAFAGGTVLMLDAAQGFDYDGQEVQQQAEPLDPNATYYTKDGVYSAADNNVNVAGKKYSKTTRKFRLGRQNYNDPNTYWNFGRVNFGNGFTSVGGGDKKY